MTEDTGPNLVELATELTIAWLGNPNNRAVAEDVPAFLRTMYSTVSELSGTPVAEPSAGADVEAPQHYEPAVTVKKSLASRDHIISLIDGKSYRTLRRHLGTHGLTPAQYRERYNLKRDYPMVAPNYSEERRAMAIRIGLGVKGRAAKSAVAAPAVQPAAPGPATPTPKKPSTPEAPKLAASTPPKAATRKPRAKKVVVE